MKLAAFVGWTICALLQDAPAPLERAVDLTRAEHGFQFTYERHQEQPPHDPMRQEGYGRRYGDGTFLLRSDGSGGGSPLLLRRHDVGVVYWDGRWVDAEDVDAELGRGLDNPDTILDLIDCHATEAARVVAWRCPRCPAPPRRSRFPSRARNEMWRIELAGDDVRGVLEDLGYEATEIEWNRARVCVTVGLDDAGRIAELWLTGFVDFTADAGVDEATVGVHVQLAEFGEQTFGLVDYYGDEVDLAEGMARLEEEER